MSDPVIPLNVAFGDRYVIERKLGEGGMAIVYAAHEKKHDRRVAIKVMGAGRQSHLLPHPTWPD